MTSDNCVNFEGYSLQIPADKYRCNYVKVKVHVHRYMDGSLAVFHGPRKLADYVDQEIGEIQKMKVQRKSTARIQFMTENLEYSSLSVLSRKVKVDNSFATKADNSIC